MHLCSPEYHKKNTTTPLIALHHVFQLHRSKLDHIEIIQDDGGMISKTGIDVRLGSQEFSIRPSEQFRLKTSND